jgi:hypothetical protein
MTPVDDTAAEPLPDWSDGIRPYTPLSTLKPLAEGIWWVDGPVRRMNIGPVSLPFPTRMVVIRLHGDGLWLWSPTAPTEALFAELDAIGRVEHLVSPNRFHYAAIPAWKSRYPHATAWASPGVRERARSQNIEVAFDADLSDAAPSQWAGEIDQFVFRGSRLIEEVVFLHRPSSTLLLADMVLALEQERVRPPLRWLFGLFDILWPGQTPLEVRVTAWGQKSQVRASYQRLLEWQPRHVILGHGRCFLEDGTAQLERAFAWLR